MYTVTNACNCAHIVHLNDGDKMEVDGNIFRATNLDGIKTSSKVNIKSVPSVKFHMKIRYTLIKRYE